MKQLVPEAENNDTTIWIITRRYIEDYQVHLKSNNKPIKMELDTRVAVSVMSEQQWKATFGKTKLLQPYKGQPLQSYLGHEVQIQGQANIDIE